MWNLRKLPLVGWIRAEATLLRCLAATGEAVALVESLESLVWPRKKHGGSAMGEKRPENPVVVVVVRSDIRQREGEG